jgi:hypothetical protein
MNPMGLRSGSLTCGALDERHEAIFGELPE